MPLEALEVAVIALVSAVAFLLAALLLLERKRRAPQGQDSSAVLSAISEVKGGLQGLQQEVTTRLSESRQTIHELVQRSDEQVNRTTQISTQLFGEVKERVGRLEEATQKLSEMSREIVSLQDVLRPPKLRGGIGEMLLENLLGEILPRDFYTPQYTFRSGDRVDVVIRTGHGLVPVDAKFPLENFRVMLEAKTEEERNVARKNFARDVQGHIKSIAKKYIVPDEGTVDFALMYIPAENVYYETVLQDGAFGERGLLSLAHANRVFPVSPNTFYTYLMTLAVGFKGMKIEQRAKEIASELSRLSGDFSRFHKEFETIGTHIMNAQKKYADAEKQLGKVQSKLGSLQAGETEEVAVGLPKKPEEVSASTAEPAMVAERASADSSNSEKSESLEDSKPEDF